MLLRFILQASFAILFTTHYFLLTTPALAEPLTLTDATGRTVRFSKPPSRIISLAPSITEILFALGLDHQVVGVTTSCDYPPQAKKKRRIGGAVSPDLETLIGLKPDLILGAKELHRMGLIDELERFGLPLYITNPVSVNHILNDIKTIGRLVNHVSEANHLVMQMQKKLESVEARVKSYSKTKVLYVLWNDPLTTVTSKSFIGELMDMAGGENIVTSKLKGYVRFSMEEVLVKNPDVIIFASEMGERAASAERKRWNRWHHLAAVKNERLYVLDSDLLHRPGPRIVEGLERLEAAFHPGNIPRKAQGILEPK